MTPGGAALPPAVPLPSTPTTGPRPSTSLTVATPLRDVALAAALALAWFVTVDVLRTEQWWNPRWVSAWWWCGAALAVAVAGRRTHPAATFWAVVVGYPLAYRTGLQSELHLAPVLVAAFAGARAGVVGPVVGALATAGGTLALLVPGGLVVTRDLALGLAPWRLALDTSYTVALVCLACAAVALGVVVHRLEAASADLAARNAELRRLQAERTERAVLAERTRIARELHDVVAHHVSAIVVRAQAATRVAGRRPEAPVEATEWIAGAGKEALAAMRGLVHVLRTDDRVAPSALATDRAGAASAAVTADLAPAPGLDDVARAAARLRDAGVAVDLAVPAPARDVPADVGLAVARIAQEALTNVLLHSHAAHVDVRVEDTGTHLHLTVRDPGPPRADDAARPGGHGLAHMRERARACGGTVEVGPQVGGGWAVRATLPVAARPEAAR